MKKVISMLLVFAMVIALLPAQTFADIPADATGFSFTGTGDWQETTARVDNTADYELGMDIDFVKINSASGNDTWADKVWVVIRNEADDNYIKIELQSYINRNGKYQVYVTAQVYDGKNWSDRPEAWSADFDSAVSKINIVISYDQSNSNYIWSVKNRDNNSTINTGSTGSTIMTQKLKTCNDCQIRFYRNDNNISTANCYSKLIENGSGKTPEKAEAFVFTGTGDWQETTARVDNTADYELGMDIDFVKINSASGNDTWADKVWVVIRNEADDNYIKIELQSYINRNGKYQVYVTAQVYDGKNWSDRPEAWSADFDSAVSKLNIVISYDQSNSNYIWSVKNRDNNSTINTGSTGSTIMTQKLKTCNDCQIRLYRNDNAITASNCYISKSTSEGPTTTKKPGDFGWYTDDDDFTGWEAEDEGNFICTKSATNPRTWKPVFNGEYVDNFDFNVTIQGDFDGEGSQNNSYPSIILFGHTIEFDSRGAGNSNQVFVKLDGEGAFGSESWLNANEREVTVNAVRKDGGDIAVSLSGTNGTTMKIVLDNVTYNENIELKGCAGHKVRFSGISIDIPETNQYSYTKETGFKAVTDENGLAFITKGMPQAWLKYNGVLDASADTSFSFDFTSLESKNNNTVVCFKLTFVDDPEEAIFTRIQMDGSGKIAIKGERWDAQNRQWHTAYGGNDWSSYSVTDSTLRVNVSVKDDTLTITLKNKLGNTLATYNVTENIANLFDSETLRVWFYSQGDGELKLSNITLPELKNPDLRSEAFESVVVAGDVYNKELTSLREEFEKSLAKLQGKKFLFNEVEDSASIVEFMPDLVVVALDYDNGSVKEYLSMVDTYVDSAKACKTDPVVMVVGCPALAGSKTNSSIAEINANLYKYCKENDCLYVDLINAFSGQCPSADSLRLVMGEIIHQLARNCTALISGSNYELNISKLETGYSASDEKNALDAFNAASTAEKLESAVLNGALGLNLAVYKNLSTADQNKMIAELLKADRNGLSDIEAAVLFEDTYINLFGGKAANLHGQYKTWVAVGDSITYGVGAYHRDEDSWVNILHNLIRSAQGQEIELINKAISGTRMSTITDNQAYPAAKDTVDEYITPYNPDLLTIAYGINDLNAGTDIKTFIDDYRTYLTEITTKLPNATIAVCGMGPMWNDSKGDTIRVWNAEIKKLAESFGLIYIETYNDTVGIGWLLDDGLHPTNGGHALIAHAAMRELSEHINWTSIAVDGPATESGVSIAASAIVESTITARFYAGIESDVAEKYEAFKFMVKLGEGKWVETEGKEEAPGSFVFDLENICSQFMADEIKINIIGVKSDLSEEVIRTVDSGLSIKKYCELVKKTYSKDEGMIKFLANMLNFGAECQKFINWNTDNLATDGLDWVADKVSNDKPETNVEIVSSKLIDSKSSIFASGLRVMNKIAVYFDVYVDNNANTKVKISLFGDETIYDMSKVESYTNIINNGSGKYRIYLDEITPYDYDSEYTCELISGGQTVQKVNYSVNTYLARMSEDSKVGALCYAIYNYGLAAIKL